MSLSRKSPERKAKLKASKERWEKGETGFQRAGRFLFNKESYKETKAKWKKDREDKKAGKETKPKSSTKARALMTKAQRKEADRKKRVARAKAYRAKK